MPKRSFNRTSELLDVTQAQVGLVTAAQLAQLGVATSTISRRTRAGGMWTRVLPSVHLITGGNPDQFQREVAAALYCGDDSMITGLAALHHHGLALNPDDEMATTNIIHVLIPHARRVTSTGFVVTERTRHMPPPHTTRTYPRLAIAPPDRAVADAARHLRDRSNVQALISEVVRRGIASIDDITAALVSGPRQGSAHLRAALDHARLGAWSAPEGDLIEIVRTTGLPTPLLNRRLTTGSGRFIAIPDAWFDDVGLALEVDSHQHHAGSVDLDRTIRRNAAYARAGIPCLPLTPNAIRNDPHGVAIAIIDAYQAAALTPRPNVRVSEPVIFDRAATIPFRWAG